MLLPLLELAHRPLRDDGDTPDRDFPVVLTQGGLVVFNPSEEHNLVVTCNYDDDYHDAHRWCRAVVRGMQRAGFHVTAVGDEHGRVDVGWADTIYPHNGTADAMADVLDNVHRRTGGGCGDVRVVYVPAVEDVAVKRGEADEDKLSTWGKFTEILTLGPAVGVFVVGVFGVSGVPFHTAPLPVGGVYWAERKMTMDVAGGEVSVGLVGPGVSPPTYLGPYGVVDDAL